MTRGQVLGAKVRPPRPVALPRERVDALLDRAWQHPVTMIVAPAGSGKTSALGHFATRVAPPFRVAWYRAESSEGNTTDLLRHLERAVRDACGSQPSAWSTVEAAAAALERLAGDPLALVVDDVHTLEGTGAEDAIGDLIRYLPPSVHLLLGGRRLPGFDLSRLRVSGDLLEIGPEDLRFRAWEVEQLFRDHYREPLPPVELADLARRTGGWAAGLQLFHLATKGRSAVERSQILHSLSSRLRSMREYLTRNLLEGLDDELRGFLLRTSVLGRLSATLCDRLLDINDSARLLAEAERRHLFLTTDDDGATYHYHEVLRSHLAAMLVDEMGEYRARGLQQRAGRLLEEAGENVEALFAYWRAEDWAAADRLLSAHVDVVGRPSVALEAIPAGLANRDGWTLLATARRQLAMGSWAAAADTYRQAEAAFGGGRQADVCQRERAALLAWLRPSSPAGGDWTSHLRRALQADPLPIAAHLYADPSLRATGVAPLAAGLATAAGGHLAAARDLLEEAAAHPGASPTTSAFALFAGAVTEALAGIPSGRATSSARLARAAEAIDGLAPPWLSIGVEGVGARGSDGLLRLLLGAKDLPEVAALPWAEGMVSTLAAAVAAHRGDAGASAAAAKQALAALQPLGAGVLLAWARAFAALAAAATGADSANRVAVSALQMARAAGCPGALALACRVVALTGPPSGRDTLVATAARLEGSGAVCLQPLIDRLSPADTTGTATPAAAAADARDSPPPVLEVMCFGPFELLVGGRPVDLSAVKPRARTVLQLLAVGAGHPVHRDELLGALWPDDDVRSGTRSLQVAVSSLRQALEPATGRPAASLIVRDGDAYRLALAAADKVDVATFNAAFARGAAARRADDRGAAVAAGWRALEVYRGELLAGSGSPDWVVERRERFRMHAAEAAQELATLLVEAGDPGEAVVAAERGLAIDRYRDGLWRALISALEANGDRAAAAKASLDYEAVLAELGL